MRISLLWRLPPAAYSNWHTAVSLVKYMRLRSARPRSRRDAEIGFRLAIKKAGQCVLWGSRRPPDSGDWLPTSVLIRRANRLMVQPLQCCRCKASTFFRERFAFRRIVTAISPNCPDLPPVPTVDCRLSMVTARVPIDWAAALRSSDLSLTKACSIGGL